MADPVSLTIGALSAAATVAQGLGSMQEANFQAEQANSNADILRQNAYRTRLETAINEDRERQQNRRILAQNTAASIEQGMGNSTTTIGVLGQQATDLEQNALDLRYKGLSSAEGMDIKANYLNQSANITKKQGKNQFYMSLLQAPISFAKGYTSMGGTW